MLEFSVLSKLAKNGQKQTILGFWRIPGFWLLLAREKVFHFVVVDGLLNLVKAHFALTLLASNYFCFSCNLSGSVVSVGYDFFHFFSGSV